MMKPYWTRLIFEKYFICLFLIIILHLAFFSMNFNHQVQAFRNSKKETQTRKCYQKLLHQDLPCQFIYRKGTKYICLTVQKIQGDIFYTDFIQIAEENKVIKSYLLDLELSVIWEGSYTRFLEKELMEKQGHSAFDNSHKSKKNQFNSYRLCFEKGIFKQPQINLPPIQYRRYPAFQNFIIGRGYVRALQAHRLSSDLISKQHCELIHSKSNGTQALNYIKTIKKILLNYTSLNSNVKKIPSDIWHNIFQYIKPKQKYILVDLGSRNGTWIYQEGTQTYKIQQSLVYQFQKQSYQIHIMDVFTSRNTQNYSIIQHNQKAHQKIQQFKKEVNWNYYQRANKIILLQDAENLLLKQDQKIQVLVFKVKYADYNEFYLLASNKSSTKKYSVGCKYDIDINPQQYDTPSLHGKIYLSNGNWMIESFQFKRNGQYRKIWTKLPKGTPCTLNYLKNYKIRLASSFYFNLEFHNF